MWLVLSPPPAFPDTHRVFLYGIEEGEVLTVIYVLPHYGSPTGRDGTGRDGTGRDGTGRDGTGWGEIMF